MAEEYEKFKRFEYRMNSNLVLQREGPGPLQNEPTGEPESLVGRLTYKMGDKVQFEQPKQPPPATTKKPTTASDKHNLLDIRRGATVLDLDVTETYSYKPTTRASRAIYEKLLKSLQHHLGDQPQEILKGAADELLLVLHNNSMKDVDRKKQSEDILGKLTDVEFNKLYQTSKQLSDYKRSDLTAAVVGGRVEGDSMDDTSGVAVVFDEEDEAEGGGDIEGEVEEEEDEEEDDQDAEEKELRYLAAKPLDEEEFAAERDRYGLDISKIDPHWLQRELGNIFTDPNFVIATEKEILSILPIPDIQECENKLVFILKYDNFDFAKLILKNRWKIFYCTRLGQAQTQEDKESIHEEMRGSEAGEEVLAALETVNLRRNKEKEIARNVRKEAATLAAKANREIGDNNSSLATAEDEYGVSVVEDDMKKPSQHIDLNAVAFAQGGHFMSNARVKLPEGSQRIEKKAYDEVVVQPYKKPQHQEGDTIKITAMPSWTHEAFTSAGIDRLNPIQSKVYKTAFEASKENMLLCAPTGAGKTNVALLAMLNTISQFRNPDTGIIDTALFKIVYISPMKALVAEQVQSFSIRLESYGITVRELTGDISLTRAQIGETQVIVTTPEKWDIITRKAGERTYTELVRLIIIDEVHLLHDSRGPVLEGIVGRTIRQMEATQEYVRLVGLSATLPNYEDVAVFMRVNPEKGLFYFGNHYRPVPLLQTYIGIKDKKAIKRYNTMNAITYEKVMENAGKNQVLVFVHSRKETIRTARALRDMAMENDALAKFLQKESASREVLQTETDNIKTNEVKDLLPYGLAVHHAGLPRPDRKLIEDLFADRHIQVLVSTATLAWGVNLPAHTVIIKGTQVYMPEKGQWVELSPMDVMQMMGRGGRPQYDSSGHGVIITNHSELQFYLSLNNQQLPIESQMLTMLPDMLNAEIVLGTIRSRADAVGWLSYTYLYVRMIKNPTLYGVPEDADLEQRRIDLVHSALVVLDKHNLAKYDKRTGAVQVTALGRVASHYYIKHATIAVFNQHLKPTMSDIELLRLFSLSNEFKYIPVREEEKVELQKLMERVPVPVKGSSEESSSKVNVLLQAYISKLKLEGFALMSDMVYVQQSAGRIMRAIFDICLKRGWAALALRALQFCKMIDKRMWGSMSPLRQFKGVPDDLVRKLEKKDFAWDRYYDLSSTELGELVRVPKMGKILHRLVHQFPKLELAAYVQPLTRTCLAVELTITVDFQWDTKVHGQAEPFWILVEDGDSETILHSELFILRAPHSTDEEHTVLFTVPITEPLPPNYYVRAVSDRWLHAECVMPISFKTLILPERNPPHTELLDLQPLPVTALKFPQAEALYSTFFKAFNPIQTQVFSCLYNSNDNVLICAPPASGKIVCAEFAILRMIQHDSVRRAVYVAPYELTVRERLAEWTHKFGKLMGLTVAELTGDTTHDLKTLERSNIVLSTPDKWDFVSRRWKTRKVLQQISLFIVDELELLDSETMGATLEVCVSRMRYISAQLVQPIRAVGLACSLANAKDVGDWLGAPTNGLFNFHPNMRPVPLEISIHGFDLSHRESRLLAMSKPVYQAIKHHAPDEPAIIFVSDRKQCRLTAMDILLQAAADRTPKRFLHVPDEIMEQQLKSVHREMALAETLKYGVAFYHEGFSATERALVERLFESGAVQVVVATEQLAWGMTMAAKLVVVMDTKRYTPNGYIDYPMCDMLQLMGRATRPYVDTAGVVVLLTHTAKKEYYKKFIFEPLPVESRLDQRIADHVNAEVVLKTIENKQDAVDWLTWTFYYRRLTKNPNYYGLQGVTHQHLSDHLSELVESTIDALVQAQCVSVEEDVDITALNLGLISSFYYVRYTTVELFNRSLSSSTRRKGMLEVLSAASEYDTLPVRAGEEGTLKLLAKNLGVKLGERDRVNDAHVKTLILLYAHFKRSAISTDLAADQKMVLENSVRLVQALVDVISSNGWLQPELVAMELSQMIVQALTPNQSPLFQLPHFTNALVQAAKDVEVEDIFGLMDMDEEPRAKLLQDLSTSQLADVARACNRYPVITLDYSTSNKSDTAKGGDMKINAAPGESISLTVKLERDTQEEGTIGPVYAPFYPREKEEQWWVVIGEPSTGSLSAIKRVTLTKTATTTVKLEWEGPEEKGEYNCVMFFMADSYMGCDQEYKFTLSVV
eukprot:GHVS01069806.1.p1 GENE.GHVS01069806.1~~GHVS01069806.1.p1  ORF type:complete len:2164 (-),score=326.56 GHVS01069806.1:2269-8760(-)